MSNSNVMILRDTLRILERGRYIMNGEEKSLKLTLPMMEEARVFLPDDLAGLVSKAAFDEPALPGPCKRSCANMDSFTMARAIRERHREDLDRPGSAPVLVLNMANPVHPGGGVLNGASAQEEDLCRKSSLLVSLTGKDAAPYYVYNRALNSWMGSDALIIHPRVEIIKDEKGDLLPDTVLAAVMTCAAPVLPYVNYRMSDRAYQDIILARIRGMLAAAACLGYRYLVLGAFGCGAFGNDAGVVSRLFQEALDNLDLNGRGSDDLFARVDFAVLDRSRKQYNYKQFAARFPDVEWMREE